MIKTYVDNNKNSNTDNDTNDNDDTSHLETKYEKSIASFMKAIAMSSFLS